MKNGLPTTQTQQVRQETVPPPEDSDDEENPFVGPYRVFPGRLSVCRTFGDCEAKVLHLGGIKGVVSCEPETTIEEGGANYLDYALIASDGVFDKMKNDYINQIVWEVTTKARMQAHTTGQVPSIHQISGQVADEILHAAARFRSLDKRSVTSGHDRQRAVDGALDAAGHRCIDQRDPARGEILTERLRIDRHR